jgi:hypothetical protein
VHNVLLRAAASEPGSGGTRIEGAVLLHPYFVGSTAIEGESESAVAAIAKLWAFACPDAADPWINPTVPGAEAGLDRLGCDRVLVCAVEEDLPAARDRAYYDAVAASAWPGSAAWLESERVGHVFFLMEPECENAKRLVDRIVAFIAGS